MYHSLVIFATAVSFTRPWCQDAPLFGHFWHCGVLYQPMVTTCTAFFSFLSSRCPLPVHCDNMHHFFVIIVTAVSSSNPLLQHVSHFRHFCHCDVLKQPMVTTFNPFWSFLSPRCPLASHGDNMYHFLVIFVTAVYFGSPWCQHAPLFGQFCHRGVLKQPMVTICTTFLSFLSPRCSLPAHDDNML